MCKPMLLRAMLAAAMMFSTAASGMELSDADEVVRQANLASYYRGADGRSEARMIIEDRQGRKQQRQFTILRRDHEEGGDQQFLVVFSRPADVRNTVFLVEKHARGDDDRWLYLPGLDLVKRIAGGDKRTSFVGSHFFYEDVSGRNLHEDKHRLISIDEQFYYLESQPKHPASVEFNRYRVVIDKQTLLPMTIEYYNDSDVLYRRVEVLKTETIQGFPTVTRSRVSDLVGGGHTTLAFRFIGYDLGMTADVFSERSLRRPPQQWLKRPQ